MWVFKVQSQVWGTSRETCKDPVWQEKRVRGIIDSGPSPATKPSDPPVRPAATKSIRELVKFSLDPAEGNGLKI